MLNIYGTVRKVKLVLSLLTNNVFLVSRQRATGAAFTFHNVHVKPEVLSSK